MSFKYKSTLLLSSLLLVFLLFAYIPFVGAQSSKFTLVIDAGHGGHDPGAIGDISREKDINLAVSLQLGALVERNFSDVKVVYTRKTDKYLTLQERADIVNNNHADLFICIHTNSAKAASAFGAETFTLGLAKSKANLDVAMRENSVILLEDDYKSKYRGFDPSSVDSYIMFEFMQDKYIDKSVDLASNIQKQFTRLARRSDRGVRQAGFWVLHRSACPSVLVELGFISNPSEERFLASESGQSDMAASIYNAFVNFKRDHDKKSGKQVVSANYVEAGKTKGILVDQKNDTDAIIVTSKEKVEVKTADSSQVEPLKQAEKKPAPVYKVQLFASNTKLKANAADFKGLKDADFFVEGGLYKYTLGAETDYSKIVIVRKQVVSKFPGAFIIAFVGDKKMTVNEALKLNK